MLPALGTPFRRPEGLQGLETRYPPILRVLSKEVKAGPRLSKTPHGAFHLPLRVHYAAVPLSCLTIPIMHVWYVLIEKQTLACTDTEIYSPT